MVNEIKARIEPARFQKHRFAIVVSSFNQPITDNLLSGAVETLKQGGIQDALIDVCRVPGAWEIPLTAQLLANTEKYSAIVCLGAVIRGQTSHDQHINRFVSLALGELGMEFEIPITFGILTCEDRQQAVDRSGGDVANRGCDAAEAALQMCGLIEAIDDTTSD